MGRHKGQARVLGPYRVPREDGTVRWRVVQVSDEGQRETFYADSERAAAKLVHACLIDLGIPQTTYVTAAAAVSEFIEHKKKNQRWSERTFERTGADLRFFVAGTPEAPVKTISLPWVNGYLARIASLALASQRSRFHAVTEFLAWCVRKGHLAANPAESIDSTDKPWEGKRAKKKLGRGKPQLRNATEVACYLDAARRCDTPEVRVASVLPLLCGLRSGEVRHLRVGDCDFAAGKLWVRDIDEDDGLDLSWDVKTAAGRRTVDMPSDVVDDLRALVAGQGPDMLVFRSRRLKGLPFERKWLNRRVQEVCVKAEVRVICAHGLRDTYCSLLTALAGKSPVEIARLVGHADQGATAKKHYIGAPEHVPVLRLLAGGQK